MFLRPYKNLIMPAGPEKDQEKQTKVLMCRGGPMSSANRGACLFLCQPIRKPLLYRCWLGVVLVISLRSALVVVEVSAAFFYGRRRIRRNSWSIACVL